MPGKCSMLLAVLLVANSLTAQDTADRYGFDTTGWHDLDTSYSDYDELFNEIDALLDSLLSPSDFFLFNAGVGNSIFNYRSKTGYDLDISNKITITPTLAYFSKTGLGLGITAVIVDDNKKLNPYQFYITGSYDYLRNKKFLTGVAYTHFITKDSLPFYTSPLRNELYAYFTYKKWWLRPMVAVSYGWGNRDDYIEREGFITAFLLRRNGFTRINTRESIHDFSVITSLRHDFYWMEVLGKNDYIRLTPQVVLTSGTQKFGFNQTSSTYATLPRNGTNVLFSSNNFYLDDELYFQPISLSAYVKAEYSKGKFFIQPQVIFDYYFPANNNNFAMAFVINAGVIF